MKQHIYWQYDKSTSPVLGRKVSLLGELPKIGIHSPPCYCLSKFAFIDFLNQNNIYDTIQELLTAFSEKKRDAKDIGRDISTCFETVEVPPAIKDILLESHQKLLSDTKAGSACAVRSSSIIEDLDKNSFAGLYESFLDVDTQEGLLTSVVKCWQSAFAVPVLSYLKNFQIKVKTPADLAMGVFVQPMLEPKTSGVMFTVNPINGDPSKIAIEYVNGRNQKLLSGECTPNSLTIDKISRQINYLQTVKDEPQLEERYITELASVGKKIEDLYGCYQDIEWIIDDRYKYPGNIFVIQTRPETVWNEQLLKSSTKQRQPQAGFMPRLPIKQKPKPTSRDNIYNKILAKARTYCRDEIDRIHMESAKEMAEIISAKVGGNPRIIIPAVILHDIGWYTFSYQEEQQARGLKILNLALNRRHELEGARLAEEILTALKYPQREKKLIIEIINGHDSRQYAISLEDRVVKDADKLSRYSPDCFALFSKKFADNEDHFYEYLKSRLDNLFYTDEARLQAKFFILKRKITNSGHDNTEGIKDRFFKSLIKLEDDVILKTKRDLEKLAIKQIKEKLNDVKKQIEIFLRQEEIIDVSQLQQNEEFKKIAVQEVAETGYTAIIDRITGSPIFHIDTRVINLSLEEFKKERPADQTHGFWDWYMRAVEGHEFSSYYKSKDQKDQIRDKFQYALPLDLKNVKWSLVATAFLDEFLEPVEVLSREIANSVDSISNDLEKDIIDPIMKLATSTEKIGDGDLSYRIDMKRDDEIGFLATKLDIMMEKLDAAQQESYKREQELINSEEKYRSLFNLAPDGICITSLDGKFVSFNDVFLHMFKYKTNQLKKMSVEDLYLNPVKDRSKLIKEINKKGKIKNRELKMIDGHGKTIHTSSSHTLINYEGTICIETITRDVTAERKKENEINYLKSYLANIIESMPSMLISIDREGIITRWNQSAVDHLNIKSPQAIGKKLWTVLPYFEENRQKITDIIYSQQTTQFKRERLERARARYYDITIFPLITNGTEGLVLIIEDISEIEKKEQALRQAQKMETIGLLAGGLAHDFNNVLGGIMGTLSIIMHKMQHSDHIKAKELEKFLNTMKKAGQRAIRMVEQLLALARKQELSIAPVNLNTALRHVMVICKNSFDKSIEFVPIFHNQKAVVKVDPTQIEQVLLNLCINARDSMTTMRPRNQKWGGQIQLSVEFDPRGEQLCKTHPDCEKMDYWKVSVSDTGIGMDAETVEKIFDPFFTKKERGKGTGLGLAMVYNIIKQHNGFIDVYSEIDKGSNLNIYLPAIEPSALEDRTPGDETIPRGDGLVLVVDDEDIMRETAKAILQECGYKVILAKDGEAAVKIFQKRHQEIRIVLLDMVMPKLSGKDAFEKIKKINPDVKVVLSSGFKQDDRVEETLKLGIATFIQKPYTLAKLAQTVQKVLATES